METNEERELSLTLRQERERYEERAKWRILDYLDLGSDVRTSVCAHPGKEPLKPNFSVSVYSKTFPSGLEPRRGLRILDHIDARMTIPSVGRWKEGQHVSDVWMPMECNFSRIKPGADEVGSAQVELTENGNSKFRVRKVSFWIQMPDGRKEFVELTLQLSTLPTSWTVNPLYTACDPHSGDCAVRGTLEKPSGLPTAYVRVGMGAADSWRVKTYWNTVDEFRKELLGAGI